MTEQVLDHAHVDAAFQEMSGKAMAQGVDRDLLVQAGGLRGEAAGELQRASGQWPLGVEARGDA